MSAVKTITLARMQLLICKKSKNELNIGLYFKSVPYIVVAVL